MQMKRSLWFFCAGVMALTAACGRIQPVDQTAPSQTEESITEGAADTEEEQTETTEGSLPGRTGQFGDPWILPESDRELYEAEELAVLSPAELRIARNEIYARHGRTFKDSNLRSYFLEKDWYQPITEGDFDESALNETEKENLLRILEAEKKAETLSCPQLAREEYPRVDGSTATLPLSQALYRLSTGASAEEAERDIVHNKTSAAYYSLQRGKEYGASLVLAYAPSDEYLKELEEAGDPLLIQPIGRDALVFMANASNPVESLTEEQLVGIYSGQITNWKEAGGRDQEICAFQRPPRSGSQNLMDSLVMQGREMAPAPENYIFSEMEGILDALSSYDNRGNGLGYSVYFYAKNMYEKPELRFMSVNGIPPSNETIRDGSYPYISEFYAAIRRDEPEGTPARQLFDWLTTDNGQALINGLGYVGLRETETALPEYLTRDSAQPQARLELKEGMALAANGDSFSGEAGLYLLDGALKETDFFPGIRYAGDADLFLCPKEGCLPVLDQENGKFGLYSLKERAWAEEPVYDWTEENENGILLERWQEDQEVYLCVLVDHQGRRIAEGEEDAVRAAFEKGLPPRAMNEEEFAAMFPQLLEQHGVGVKDIQMWYPMFDGIVCVKLRKGNTDYVYDRSGRYLFAIEEDSLPEGHRELWYTDALRDFGNGRYGLSVDTEDGQTYLLIYQNGTEQKRILLDGWLFEAGEGFYAVYAGSYVKVYDLEGRLCGKYLSADMKDD